MTKPLHLEDRKREVCGIDPATVLLKVGVAGAIDQERRMVLVKGWTDLAKVAGFLGRKVAQSAVGFYAHGWLWQVWEHDQAP